MEDLDFLLEWEKEYSKQHLNYPEHKRIPISFHLRNINEKIRENADKYKLNELELLTIIMMLGSAFDLVNDPSKCLIMHFKNALLKLPKYKGDMLYRQDRYTNTNSVKKGSIFLVEYSFTCSTEDFDCTSNIKWIIETLPEEKTKARELYCICNIGVIYKEWQVNFLPNTKFFIDEIIKKEGYTEIKIKEIE